MGKDNNRKILFVLPNDFLGGAEQFLQMLAKFHARECQVHVVFLKASFQKNWNHLPDNLHCHFPSRRGILGICEQVYLLCKLRSFNRIYTSHVYMTALVGFLLRARCIKKEKFIARESTSVFQRFRGFKLFTYKLAYKLGYQSIDLLICQTELMDENLKAAVPSLYNRFKVRVIPNPIDLDNAAERGNATPPIGIQKPFIVAAGRLIPEKGFDILIKAFNNLNVQDIVLVILGDGKERGHLEALSDTLEIRDRVYLPGNVTNVYPYFRDAKLCVVSSRIEGFPNVLLQMMSQNANVVSTVCAGGISSIPGLITCEADSITDLQNAIRSALDSRVNNAEVFEKYLKDRSIASFVGRINKIVNC